MWLALKHINGTLYVCRPDHVPDILNEGEAVYLVLKGEIAYKVATEARAQSGTDPDMRYVHAHLMERKSHIGRPPRPVQCVETGIIYESTSKAAEALGCSQGNLSKHLQHPTLSKTVKGHTFKYYT